MRERVQWLAVLGGVALYFAMTRGAVLDPRNTGWLLLHIDSATGYLGWEFFRRAPLVQLPLGANPQYGLAMASSVVFSDSIPLLALLFKPLDPLLPPRFQYFGLWLLACFALQALFGYRLLRGFLPNARAALLGAAFFALAPVFLYRTLGHLALSGQWMILAALCLYFAPRNYPGRWVALLVAGALVHFYLLLMIGALWAADLWQRLWRGDATWRRAAGSVVGGVGATLAAMWLAGYFVIDRAVAVGGFGRYRMNLLAPLDPNEGWSQLLPDLPGSRGEVEGFNYLGIGILALAVLVVLRRFATRQRTGADRRSLVPLASMAAALTLLALSSHIGLGRTEVLAYALPGVLRAQADIVRSSGRLFWPVVYLVYLAVLVLAFRVFAARTAALLCLAALATQVVDSVSALGAFRWQFVAGPAWSSPLRAPLWAELGKRYRRVVYVMPRNAADAFAPWALFALGHGMAVNFGYFARVDAARLSAARRELEAAALGYRLDPDSLYVFENRALWRIAAVQEQGADVVGVLDGARIIAPGLKACAACDLRGLRDMWRENLGAYELGQRVALSGAAPAAGGWSLTEEWDSVSRTSVVWLAFTLAEVPAADLVLSLETDRARPPLEVRLNGAALANAADPAAIAIPRATAAHGRILVELRRTGTDDPTPGLGLVALTLGRQ